MFIFFKSKPDSDIYNRIRHSNYAYTQQLCLGACLYKQLIDACQCVKPNELTFYTEARPCLLDDKCMSNFTKTYFDYKHCSCPLQCNRTQYLFSMSMLPLTANFANYLQRNFADDFVTRNVDAENSSKSVSRIYVFYDTLAYTKSIETATSGSVLDLIANVGGILGLFLGVSLLSLFEAFEILIDICFLLYNRRSKRKILN